MKLVLVVDDTKSALFTAATARAKITNAKVLVASDFPSSAHLLRALIQENPSVALFTWRRALLDTVFHKEGMKLLIQLREGTSIGVLIPDHLGLEPLHFDSENKTLHFSDFYLVTSELLFSLYSNKMRAFPPYGILHDIPNYGLIHSVRAENRKVIMGKPTIIWVGNSKWGKRYGFSDHKGFTEVITPLQSIFRLHNYCMDLDVIDSSRNQMEQIEVLKRIQNANVLLQVSKSEGSGLPILEALGLGTQVLTTPVGISTEVFEESSNRHFTSRNAEEIHQKLHALIEFSEPSDRISNIEKFEKYVESVSSEVIPEGLHRDVVFVEPKNILKKIYVRLTWIYRYYRRFLR
jgi:hypothetical protein